MPKRTNLWADPISGNVHSALHSAMYGSMKHFGMNYKPGKSGQKVIREHGRPAVLQKLADFYKGMGNQHPDLKRAADDFFGQHPTLK